MIDAKLWRDQLDPTSEAENPVVLALDVPPDRQCASIGSAGRRTAGGVHVELVDRRPGTGVGRGKHQTTGHSVST